MGFLKEARTRVLDALVVDRVVEEFLPFAHDVLTTQGFDSLGLDIDRILSLVATIPPDYERTRATELGELYASENHYPVYTGESGYLRHSDKVMRLIAPEGTKVAVEIASEHYGDQAVVTFEGSNGTVIARKYRRFSRDAISFSKGFLYSGDRWAAESEA